MLDRAHATWAPRQQICQPELTYPPLPPPSFLQRLTGGLFLYMEICGNLLSTLRL